MTTNWWTTAYYEAVEIQQNGTEEELIGTLVDAGIYLKSASKQGKPVITVACGHRNENLIDYMLTHHLYL